MHALQLALRRVPDVEQLGQVPPDAEGVQQPEEGGGLLPGPGTGAYLEESDRIVMAGHFQTAEREDGRVVIYYSDDGGLTYSLAPSGRFPRADEAMVAHTGGSNLTVNLRRDVTECEVCPPKVSLPLSLTGQL